MKKLLITFLALLLYVPSAWAVELATDNFNRANANPIGGDWTTIPGGLSDLKIISNKVQGSVTSTRNGAYNVTAVGNDQFSQAVITTAVGDSPCVVVRASASDESYYALCPYVDGGSDVVDLYKRVAGVYTSIDAQFAAWAPGDTIRIEAQGTAIRGYINGALVASATDASIASGHFGILIIGTSTLTDTEIDDWAGGNFAPPAGGADFFPRRRAR